MNDSDSERKSDVGSRSEAGLNELLAELRVQRDRTRNKALLLSGVLLALTLLLSFAVASAAGPQPGATGNFLVIFIPGAILSSGAYLLMMRGVKLQYKKLVIPALLKEIDPGLAYHAKGYIPEKDFSRSKIFSSGNSYRGEDLVYGSYKGIPLRFSELKVKEEHHGGRNSSCRIIFIGVFMIADFNKDFKFSHWVLPDTAEATFGQLIGNFIQKHKLSGRGHMTRMEDVEFEKKFVVYTEDDTEARYILTPKLMRTMLMLSNRFNTGATRIAFAFMNSNVYIAIPTDRGRNLFEMPSFGALDAETVRKTKAELKDILGVFDAMELDLRIWSKGDPEPPSPSVGNPADGE